MQNGRTDRDAVGLVDLVWPRKHALHGVHIVATWRIRLNRPCSAAMQNGWTDLDAVSGVVGPKNHALHEVQIAPCQRTNI